MPASCSEVPTWGPPIGNSKHVVTALSLLLFSRPMIRVHVLLTNTRSSPSYHFCYYITAKHLEAKQVDSLA